RHDQLDGDAGAPGDSPAARHGPGEPDLRVAAAGGRARPAARDRRPRSELVDLLQKSVKTLLFVVILQAALSWLNPDNPMQYEQDAITRPMLPPNRRH